MNAELLAQMQAAATEGQSILGETFIYPLNTKGCYTGVFGTAQAEEVMMPGGGYRRREWIPLSVTETQAGFNPKTKTELRRVGNGEIFRIEKVVTTDALSYSLVLVQIGRPNIP